MSELGNFGERQDTATRDWGFLAHLSIYEFAARYAGGKACLDVGCGTGYGADHLRQRGAASMVGFDKDAGVIEVLSGRYPEVAFRAVDFEMDGLPLPESSVDLLYSSNVLEYIAYVDPVLAECARVLRPDGVAVIAVPPVMSPGMLAMNARNLFHINNIPPWAWQTKLGRYFGEVAYFRHWVRPDKVAADGGPTRDGAVLDDFVFERDDDWRTDTITSVFVCRERRAVPLPRLADEGCPESWRPAKLEAEARQEVFVDLERRQRDTLAWWRSEMAGLRAWLEQARAQGADPRAMVDAIARQLRHYDGS